MILNLEKLYLTQALQRIAIQTVTLVIHNQGVTQQADAAYELAQKYRKYRIKEADAFTE